MRKLSSQPRLGPVYSDKRSGVAALLSKHPFPDEPKLNDNGDEQPKKHYRTRATLNNTCEDCGELVQEPGDLYCDGESCCERLDNGCLLDDMRGDADE